METHWTSGATNHLPFSRLGLLFELLLFVVFLFLSIFLCLFLIFFAFEAIDLFELNDPEKRKYVSEILPKTQSRGRLLLGGVYTYSYLPLLKEAGVTHVLSCAADSRPSEEAEK